MQTNMAILRYILKYFIITSELKQFSLPYASYYFNTENCQIFIDCLDLFDKTYYIIQIKIAGIKLINHL